MIEVASPRVLAPLRRWSVSRSVRAISGLCFVGVCLALAIGGGVVAVLAARLFSWGDWLTTISGDLALLRLFGIPAAGVLGWVFAPQAGWDDRHDLDRLAIRVGALAVLLGTFTFAIAMLVATLVFGMSGWFEPVTGFALTLVFGLLILGLPAAAATIPASMAWIALFRRVIAWRELDPTVDESSR